MPGSVRKRFDYQSQNIQVDLDPDNPDALRQIVAIVKEIMRRQNDLNERINNIENFTKE